METHFGEARVAELEAEIKRIIDGMPMCRTCDLPLSNVTWERRSTQDYVYAGPERRQKDCSHTSGRRCVHE